MRASYSTTSDYDRWPHPSYEVRVRGTKFLWGSAGLSQNLKFASPLVLHFRNDTFGEVIRFGTRLANGTQKLIGSLQPGECVSLPLQNICGVFASCDSETNVCCLIRN